jgi:hypothetical protein
MTYERFDAAAIEFITLADSLTFINDFINADMLFYRAGLI